MPPRTAKPEAAPARPTEEEELWHALWDGPAVSINRMGVNVIPEFGGVKLSFAEQYSDAGPVKWRAGVVMSEWHAYQLWELLGRMEPVQRYARMAKEPAEDDAVQS
jgi:hypothetical protein